MENDTGKDATGSPSLPLVQSVDRAITILELLADRGTCGVSEISRQLGVHRSTAFRLLATLEAHGFVEQEERRSEYRLAFGILRVAGNVTTRMDLARDAQQICDDLTATTNETTNVAILDHDAAVNITQATGNHLVAVTRQYVGQRTPLHATSTGKVLLAYADEATRDRVLGARLERFTPHTITSAPALASELDRVREQGWAAAVEEWEVDTNALATPVRNHSGAVVAALSITAPSFRMPESSFAELVTQLVNASERLGRRIGDV